MLQLFLLKIEWLSFSSFCVFGVLITLYLLIKGNLAPKISLLSIGLLIAFFVINSISDSPNYIKISNFPIGQPTTKSDPRESPIPPKPSLQKKKISKKHLTKVQFEGIKNVIFLDKFEAKSDYTISKKGNYLVRFDYDGTIKQNPNQSESRFVFSGGSLVIFVEDERCCCRGLPRIPTNIPLGKNIKVAHKIMSQIIEEYALKNADEIIPMIAACLPKH